MHTHVDLMHLIMTLNLCFRFDGFHFPACHQGQAPVTDGFSASHCEDISSHVYRLPGLPGGNWVVPPSGTSNDPLFLVSRSHGAVPLAESVACRHIHSVLQKLEIVPPLKFHYFRCSGATWAFHNWVALQHIMLHGTWKSTPQVASPVPSTFQCLLHI